MQNRIKALSEQSKDKHKLNKRFLLRLQKKPPKKLDYIMQELHEEEFKNTDCMQCANCCKTTSPIFTNKDIVRIAKFLRMKLQDFIAMYLKIDKDQDYVLKSSPCVFLDEDNSCNIYNVRPKACREYPHTNRKKFEKITHLTIHNIKICPAAYSIVEKLKAKL
jgi:Fe-S-cluster containining protein